MYAVQLYRPPGSSVKANKSLSAAESGDKVWAGAVLSLSLGSQTVMELRRGPDHRPLLLPRRSLLVLGGEARYAWHHYIPHRKSDWVAGRQLPRTTRTSFTFRQVPRLPRPHPRHLSKLYDNGRFSDFQADDMGSIPAACDAALSLSMHPGSACCPNLWHNSWLTRFPCLLYPWTGVSNFNT